VCFHYAPCIPFGYAADTQPIRLIPQSTRFHPFGVFALDTQPIRLIPQSTRFHPFDVFAFKLVPRLASTNALLWSVAKQLATSLLLQSQSAPTLLAPLPLQPYYHDCYYWSLGFQCLTIRYTTIINSRNVIPSFPMMLPTSAFVQRESCILVQKMV
jgi:hypothetical protein